MDEIPLQETLFTLLLIFVLLVFSYFFSAAETSFSSLNRIRVKHKAENGSKRAALALRLYDNYDRLISAILVGNNIVNISAASITAAWSIRQFGSMGATVSAVILTALVIFFCEITPKSMAKENAEKIAFFAAPILHCLVILFSPVYSLFTKWKGLLNKIFKTNATDAAITEEELLTLVEEAEHGGTIDKEDKELIHNAIEFSELRASDILTPRMHIIGVAKELSDEAIAERFLETGYSRLPIYDGTIDNIVGVLCLRDFFEHMHKHEKNLDEIIAKALYVAPTVNINDLLKKLQVEKSHMAVITDEYGGTMGIVTMEDILEELVGEIWDESDEIIEEFIPLGEDSFNVICTAAVERFFEYFKLSPPAETDASTVGGWIMNTLGKIPEEGDTFTYENIRVTAHKTEGRRVLECLVDIIPPDEPEPGE
jgi:CBS domain containing-hemolysin-like protein